MTYVKSIQIDTYMYLDGKIISVNYIIFIYMKRNYFQTWSVSKEDFCTCDIKFIIVPSLSHERGGKGADMIAISIPVSWFHGLLWSNRGGAAAKVIRRRNDSLSAIPGYYGRNQFFRDDSLPGPISQAIGSPARMGLLSSAALLRVCPH